MPKFTATTLFLQAGICFATIGPLSRRFDERLLFVVAGILPMIIGRIVMFPYGSELPVIPRPANKTGLTNSTGLYVSFSY